MRFGIHTVILLLISTLISVAGAQPQNYSREATQILASTHTRGGLIVHLGCGQGKLTAALRANDSYLVHGLDANIQNIDKTRQNIQSLGLYGEVSFDRLYGDRLGYIDNLVNLIVVEDPHTVPMDEVMRVLAPNGTACLKKGDNWTKVTKPRSKEIDEWTQYLHDPTNNAVAHDTKIDQPRHMQWVGGPKWSRHHDHMSSSSAIVSSGNRNFYIFDEGSQSSILLPSEWFLIARDAFNGKILWKRPIKSWHTQLWRLKSGPAQLPRRLVAVGDKVYATLSLDASVTALDAATGKTIRTYPETDATEEILLSDGVLYLVVNKSLTQQPADPEQHEYRLSEGKRWIMAIKAQTGETLWKKQWKWVVPVILTVDKNRVFFFDGERIVCLDSSNGKTIWTGESPPSGYRSPEDILVVGGLVWTDSHMWGRDRDDFPKHEWGVFTGRDPHTSQVKSQFPPVLAPLLLGLRPALGIRCWWLLQGGSLCCIRPTAGVQRLNHLWIQP